MRYLPKLDLNLQAFDFTAIPLGLPLTEDSKPQTSEENRNKGGRRNFAS